MTTEKIKEYLGMVLDMEMSLYVQDKTLQNLYRVYNNLGKKQIIPIPEKEVSKKDTGEYMKGAGIIIGFIVAMVYGIYRVVNNHSSGGLSSIFDIFGMMIMIFIVGIISGLVGAVIVGPIIKSIVEINEQKELDRIYSIKLKEYNRKVEIDNKRVRNEMPEKNKVLSQIEILDKQYQETEKNLMELYSYNIIHNDYKRDIVAISSFYQYFCKGITLSLQFDPNTGDDGAYKIYENEKRLNLIISKIDIAIQKLNEIATTQTVLFDAINKANHTIDRLSNDINNNHKHLSAQINEQTAIEEYQHERILKELEYHNFMDDIYRRK